MQNVSVMFNKVVCSPRYYVHSSYIPKFEQINFPEPNKPVVFNFHNEIFEIGKPSIKLGQNFSSQKFELHVVQSLKLLFFNSYLLLLTTANNGNLMQ